MENYGINYTRNYGINYTSLENIKALAKKDPKLALKKLTSEFESLLWYEVLKNFDKSIMKSGFFPESLEKKIFQDYLYQEIARAVSGKPGGLGDFLYKHLLKSAYLKTKSNNSEIK
ncbi:MAG: rod-binding protein [Caldimicrobium sp.]